MSMFLTVLAAFAVVADEPSFTKAAIRLGVSRSAISHSVRTLGTRAPVYRWEFEKRGKPVTVSVSGPLVFTDPTFTLRAALDGLGLAYVFEEDVADYLERATS